MTCYKKDYLKRQKKQAFDSPLLDYYEVDSNTTPEQVFMFSMILTTSIARYKLIAHLIRQSDPRKKPYEIAGLLHRTEKEILREFNFASQLYGHMELEDIFNLMMGFENLMDIFTFLREEFEEVWIKEELAFRDSERGEIYFMD